MHANCYDTICLLKSYSQDAAANRGSSLFYLMVLLYHYHQLFIVIEKREYALIFKLKKQLVIRQGYSEYQSVQIDILKFQKYVKHVKRRKIYSLRKWFNEPLVVGCGQSSDYWLWVKSVHISSLENKCNINIRQAWFYTGFMGCSGIFLLVNFDGIVIRYYSLHSQIKIDIG